MQGDVLDTVKNYLPQFSAAFTCVNQLQTKVASVDEHLRELTAVAGQSSLAQASREGVEQVERLQTRMEGFDRTLVALRSLAKVRPMHDSSACYRCAASDGVSRRATFPTSVSWVVPEPHVTCTSLNVS